ncbi:hypothetical protein D3C76_1775740 [compost metagenome]
MLWLVLGPVDLTIFQCLQVDLIDRLVSIQQGIIGVLRPIVGSSNDNAVGKGLLA